MLCWTEVFVKAKESFCGFKEREYSPVVRDETGKILKEIVEKFKPKKILEIGTFIGYSACLMLESSKDCFLTTVEKDEKNVQFAVKNISEMGFEGRFEIVNCDAMEFLKNLKETEIYDLIFLDGPKGQYIKYLPYLEKALKVGGVLVADDILFYGLVNSTGRIEHKHRTIVNNLRKFVAEITNKKEFQTEILEIEDGISISIKKY